MPGRKQVKHSTKTASSESKSEGVHDDSIYIVRTPTKKLRFIQKKNQNPSTKSSNQVI